jgi:hypothetical protein
MDCEQARQLFDAYLDRELPSRLATELGAHMVRCSECRRALALMQVAGHIIACDDDSASLDEGFSHRLLACMDTPKARWTHRLRRVLYIGGPIAAAALIALAFLGVFDRGATRVAGEKESFGGGGVVAGTPPAVSDSAIEWPIAGEEEDPREEDPFAHWVDWMRQNIDKKRQSGEVLQELTIRQWLDILEEFEEASLDADHFPGAGPPAPASPEKELPDDSDGIEDL